MDMEDNMSHAPTVVEGDERGQVTAEDLMLNGEKKLTVLGGATSHAASFSVEREDHTLGNALRYFICKNPDVEFCGYTIPHPSETKMSIRIQTWDDRNTTAFDALRKGLKDLIEACGIVTEKFETARDEFGPSGEQQQEPWS